MLHLENSREKLAAAMAVAVGGAVSFWLVLSVNVPNTPTYWLTKPYHGL